MFVGIPAEQSENNKCSPKWAQDSSCSAADLSPKHTGCLAVTRRFHISYGMADVSGGLPSRRPEKPPNSWRGPGEIKPQKPRKATVGERVHFCLELNPASELSKQHHQAARGADNPI